MKFKFKVQPYQTNAVESVLDCFAGQPYIGNASFTIDPGKQLQSRIPFDPGFRNADIQLTESQLLKNIQAVQRRQNLPLSDRLASNKEARINLDVEMETGTGKTYCYIKTIFELNKRYGWNKFIIMVPSIAIREGVQQSFKNTAEHFTEGYGRKARFFVYNSKNPHPLESYSSDPGINVMIINIQAFNAKGADNRRIYDELDDFQSRRPIDVIASNRPILILDEPQKMEGKATTEALPKFKPLMILRYSATHKTNYNKVHRLDAIDAYNQKLVKKIAVRGITVKGLAGTTAYLYLESIEVSKQAPVARVELEIKQQGGVIKRVVRRIGKGDDLFTLSNGLDQYKGFVVAQIDANQDSLEFINGITLVAGEATGDVTEAAIRRIQIRETIKAHLEKERQRFAEGIKVLSLFFIDEVVKYRDYSRADEKGDYARIFEEEYETLKNEVFGEIAFGESEQAYHDYLKSFESTRVHKGYFSIDKKTRRDTDPSVASRGESAGLSDDVDAYDLILKEKGRLLTFSEPVRFIFSHSALREGWDNPNVFVMCMLKHSDNTISRRQEVGRGLRLCVNQNGDRIDEPAIVHDINVLTVVASESYKEFVRNLQKEMSEAVSARPRKATEGYFAGKIIQTEAGAVEITPVMARQLFKYLLKNDYVDNEDEITATYHTAKTDGTLAVLPSELASHAEAIFKLVDSVFSESQLPEITNELGNKQNPLNADNFNKKEFQELWARINRRAVYRVDFDSAELVRNCIRTLNAELRVTPLQYTIQTGLQNEQISDVQLKEGESFAADGSSTGWLGHSVHSSVKYDLLGKIGENVQLTRKTVAEILGGLQPAVFEQFRKNPEQFIAEATRLIHEQKATLIIEHLSYDQVAGGYDVSIFTADKTKQDFSRATKKLTKHIYDFAITDSKVERSFVEELDLSKEVVVYAKLPRKFLIPTPVGDYNPDWAISFVEGAVKHIYFVAETKGSMSSLQLSGIADAKTKCARKFFEGINKKIANEKVRYDVIDSYSKLMEVVGASTKSDL